jgi:hypothetical protein
LQKEIESPIHLLEMELELHKATTKVFNLTITSIISSQSQEIGIEVENYY